MKGYPLAGGRNRVCLVEQLDLEIWLLYILLAIRIPH